MLYCDPCAQRQGRPKILRFNHGRCEICGVTRSCNDDLRPSPVLRCNPEPDLDGLTPVIVEPTPEHENEHHQTTMMDCPDCESSLPTLEIDTVTGRGLCVSCGYRMTPEDLHAMNVDIAPTTSKEPRA